MRALQRGVAHEGGVRAGQRPGALDRAARRPGAGAAAGAPDDVLIYANADRDALFRVSRSGEIDSISVQRVSGGSRMSIAQFRRAGGKPPAPSGRRHRPALMWLSEDGSFCVGAVDATPRLQHRRVRVPARGLWALEHLRGARAFVVCGHEGDADVLHVVHARSLRVLASMALERMHRVTATLVVRVDARSELLVVASSPSDDALGAGLVSVFQVVKADCDGGPGDGGAPARTERWALELHGSAEVPSVVPDERRVTV